MTFRIRPLILLALPLLLLGAGCKPSVSDDLPTTPPERPRAEQQESEQADSASVTEVGADVAVESSGEAAIVVPEIGDEVVVAADAEVDAETEAVIEADPYYIAYSDEEFARARAEGRPIVLYFWAAWCPICKAEEPGIRSQIEGLDIPVAGFRVNYDTEKALAREYGVTYQHTLIILDTEGNETTRFLGPVSADEKLAAYAQAYGN